MADRGHTAAQNPLRRLDFDFQGAKCEARRPDGSVASVGKLFRRRGLVLGFQLVGSPDRLRTEKAAIGKPMTVFTKAPWLMAAAVGFLAAPDGNAHHHAGYLPCIPSPAFSTSLPIPLHVSHPVNARLPTVRITARNSLNIPPFRFIILFSPTCGKRKRRVSYCTSCKKRRMFRGIPPRENPDPGNSRAIQPGLALQREERLWTIRLDPSEQQ